MGLPCLNRFDWTCELKQIIHVLRFHHYHSRYKQHFPCCRRLLPPRYCICIGQQDFPTIDKLVSIIIETDLYDTQLHCHREILLRHLHTHHHPSLQLHAVIAPSPIESARIIAKASSSDRLSWLS